MPRLAAAGADLSLVFFARYILRKGEYDGRFNLARHFSLFIKYKQKIEAATGKKLRVIMLDSLADSFLKESHKNSESRDDLARVVEFAEEYKVAILGIMHLAKGTSDRPYYERVNGSTALTALARIVLAVDKIPSADKNVPDQRVLWVVKSNTGNPDIGFEFDLKTVQIDLEDSNETTDASVARVSDHMRTGNLDDILAKARRAKARAGLKDDDTDDFRPSTRLQEAQDFLLSALANDPVPQKDLVDLAKTKGIAWATLDRASSILKILKKGKGNPKIWYWSIRNESHDDTDRLFTENM
jgi:hypothetical protein